METKKNGELNANNKDIGKVARFRQPYKHNTWVQLIYNWKQSFKSEEM